MKVTMALLLLLAVAGMCVFCGCSGDDDDVNLPTSLQGTWLVVAYDQGDVPEGGTLIDVASNGRITEFEDTQVTTAQIDDDVVISGTVSETGAMSLSVRSDAETYTATGTLRAGDTGSGTWVARENGTVTDSGAFTACRANGAAWAGTWSGNVSGDFSGSGEADVNRDGVILGVIDAGNGAAELFGVVNGVGDLLAIWGVDDDVNPIVVAPGSASSENEASGSWRSDTGLAGSWEATRQPN